TVTWTGTGSLTLGNGSSRGNIQNLASGVFDFRSDAPILNRPIFNNAGTVRKSGGTGTNSLGCQFVNTGIVDVQTGTLSLNGGATFNGGSAFIGAGGPQWRSGSAGQYVISAATVVTNLGSVIW